MKYNYVIHPTKEARDRGILSKDSDNFYDYTECLIRMFLDLALDPDASSAKVFEESEKGFSTLFIFTKEVLGIKKGK